MIEPVFGSYEPDIFFRDKSGNSICVEIQLTPISHKKMQKKIEQFVTEHGKTHDSKIFVLCANHAYHRLIIPPWFKLVKQPIPKETTF